MVFLITIQLIRRSLTRAQKLHGIAWGRAWTGSAVEKDVLLFRCAKISQFLLPVYLTGCPRAETVYREHSHPSEEKGEILRSITTSF